MNTHSLDGYIISSHKAKPHKTRVRDFLCFDLTNVRPVRAHLCASLDQNLCGALELFAHFLVAFPVVQTGTFAEQKTAVSP